MEKRFQRLMTPLILLIIITSFVLTGCQTNNSRTERKTTVVFSVRSDDIFGVLFEYCLDRTRLGGQMVSNGPHLSEPLSKGKIYTPFFEEDFPASKGLDDGIFGILIWVVLEDEERIPIEYLLEWQAEYGAEYPFYRSGSKETGFSFEPVKNDGEYTITSWDELPVGFLE